MQPQAWVDRLGGIFGAAISSKSNQWDGPTLCITSNSNAIFCYFPLWYKHGKFWENNNKKQTAKSLLMSVAATATAAKSLQSCPTLQSHRRQPTRLPRPGDSPGKNTGVGCHFLLHCMKVKSESEVAQSCPTLSNPMDHSLPGSSIHGIFQAGVLEWGAIAFTDRKKIKLEQEYSPYW